LIQSCIKLDKQDFIIQKSTELGINKIYNVISDHSNAKFKTESEINKKLIRWQKIALNAARQSKRLTIPNIEICLNLDQLLSKLLCNVNNSIIIAFIEDNNIITFKEVLRAFKTPVENIYIIVGPEGGWSKEEIMLFSKYNIITTNLGRNILRAETVPIVALGILIYEFEL
ncbi:MAG: RsmE family RNA methyltransferase, partial [Cyanobacteriota bacterium]